MAQFFRIIISYIKQRMNIEKGIKMQEYVKINDRNIDKFPIAMAYVPWQKFEKLYDDLEKAYCSGTIFPELNKPFTGRRCV